MATPATPRDSASILLLRDGASAGDGAVALEVLMVRRHEESRDFAGASVFPGGGVDPADHAEHGSWAAAGFDLARARARLGEDLPEAAVRALHVAACRELFEEAGVRLTIDRLTPVARWITPTFQPRRWDTRFFAALAPADQTAVADGAETREVNWFRPADAIAAYRAGSHLLQPPTFRLLEELAGHATTAAALAAFAAAPPPRAILPVPLRGVEPLTIVYAGDRDYPDGSGATGLNRIVSRDGRWWSVRE